MIVCSLNEVEIYSRRAARGAGMAWGLAEEAGKAARWLAARELPGVELLVRLLTANEGRAYEAMAPVIIDGRWQALKGALCPICTGAALSDRIDELLRDGTLYLRMLDYPLLLVPFLDHSLSIRNACFQICWSGVQILVNAGGAAVNCVNAPAYMVERTGEITLSVATREDLTPTHQPCIGGANMSLSVWRTLDGLAKRTYVPATETSRVRGAGAGRTDND